MQPRILVPQELFAVAESSFFEGEYESPVFKAGPDLYSFDKPLTWQVTISNTGDALLVLGTVEGLARISCARCLTEFERAFTGEVEGYFLLEQGSALPEDMEEDEFSYLSEDNIIDMVPLLDAALLLDAPLIPLCDEDCKGLCVTCGTDLNKESCSCAKVDIERDSGVPHPFAALKDFSFGEDS